MTVADAMTESARADLRSLTPGDRRARVAQGAPPGFVGHVHEFSFVHATPRERVWAWLNDTRTFTRQVWPYRVEFLDGGFDEGAINVHHGPFLSVAGMMTEIDDGEDGRGRYRELRYFYGSKVVALRAIRPTALEFWVEDAETASGTPGTRVRCRLSSLVHPRWRGLWSLGQRLFWPSFRASLRRAVR